MKLYTTDLNAKIITYDHDWTFGNKLSFSLEGEWEVDGIPLSNIAAGQFCGKPWSYWKQLQAVAQTIGVTVDTYLAVIAELASYKTLIEVYEKMVTEKFPALEARINELLKANNEELERRRAVEKVLERTEIVNRALCEALGNRGARIADVIKGAIKAA